MNDLKEKVRNKQRIIGTHVSLSDPSICEILGYLDFDYIWVDMEHTYIDCEQLYIHLNAARAVNKNVIVRIPQNDFVTLKKVMEMGVDGVVFPMIKSAEEAEEAIACTYYPPLGKRGFGPRKSVKYGLSDVNDYIESGSREMCRFIQIEHIEAVGCLEKFKELDGIDGFIFGPCDLAGSIGELEDTYGTHTRQLMEKAISILDGKYIGVSTGRFDEDIINYFSNMGIHMISAGADTDYLLYGAKEASKNLTQNHRSKQ